VLFNGETCSHIDGQGEAIMPLPHFLLMIMAVVLAAALSLWASFAAGLPEIALLLAALTGAALVHLRQSDRQDHDG
jgi:hypothetical protein